MIILGLTGSIGMGKSTTAQMFRDVGIMVFDADQTVHDLYAGRAVPLVGEAFPSCIHNGQVDRQKLSEIILKDSDAIKRLEAIVHPLVEEERKNFIETARLEGANLVILDQPLLFEMGITDQVDGIIVVTAPEAVQRERVLQRNTMSEEKFQYILSQQVPDAEKRAKADFIIDTSKGLDAARAMVNDIIEQNLGRFEG